MTTPAARPVAAPVGLDDALERIRAGGGRVTAAKRSVAELLFSSDRSRTADEIVGELPGYDRSVVYRCLTQFEELGIAEHVHLGHGRAVYRRRGLGTVPVACIVCGATAELESADATTFAGVVERRTGISLDLVHFPLTGRCRECLASDASTATLSQ